jgi:hypothetical protein
MHGALGRADLQRLRVASAEAGALGAGEERGVLEVGDLPGLDEWTRPRRVHRRGSTGECMVENKGAVLVVVKICCSRRGLSFCFHRLPTTIVNF